MASELEDQLPELRTEIPGPRSRAWAERLARSECPEVTCLEPAPILWERAQCANVIDVDDNRFVDLLAGFGVVALGYAHPEIVAATARQAAALPHAMGDVYPARIKVELLERLARVLPADLGFAILSSSGSDAIESALKTALIVTGKPDIVAFEGAYHGLGFGALSVTHRSEFRERFASRLCERTHFVAYGDAEAARAAVRKTHAGAIVVEPIQGRGGLRFPPDGFLQRLREIADQEGALLIADEVYTGLGRTGRWLACEHAGVVPDVVALGKALGNGFPISACVGRERIMRSWPTSRGEAMHTSTHLGNPLGCAIALRTLELLESSALLQRAREVGAGALERLRRTLRDQPRVREVRGLGLSIGIELDAPPTAQRIVRAALATGWIVLAEGPSANVLALTPPLTISQHVLERGLDRIAELIAC